MIGYRTIVFNAIMAVVALIKLAFPGVLPEDAEIQKMLEVLWEAVVLLGNIYLRIYKTKGPIGVKDPECK